MRNDIFSDEKVIQEKIDASIETLQKNNYQINKIKAQELIAYFEGDAPSGDKITLQNILNSRWLLIHELVEINELKKIGLEIHAKLLITHTEVVFKAHLIATDWELTLAKKANDTIWIKRRMYDIKNWMENQDLANHFVKSCKDLLQKFTLH
jgi:hypothetical protein